MGPVGLGALKIVKDAPQFKEGKWKVIAYEAREKIGGIWYRFLFLFTMIARMLNLTRSAQATRASRRRPSADGLIRLAYGEHAPPAHVLQLVSVSPRDAALSARRGRLGLYRGLREAFRLEPTHPFEHSRPRRSLGRIGRQMERYRLREGR